VIGDYWQIALLIIPGYMMFNYGLNVLLWQHRKREYVFLCFLNTSLSIAGIIVAIQFLHGTIMDVFFILIGVMTFCGLLAIFLIRGDLFSKRTKAPVNYALVSKLLWFAFPFAVTTFFRMLIPSIDRYFLMHFQHGSEIHLYILAVKLASFYSIATSAFILAFTPYSLNKLNQDNAEKEISELFHLISIAAFVSVPVLLLCKDWLILFFADSSYHSSSQLLPFLFMGWVFDLFTCFAMLGVYKSQNSVNVLVILILGTVMISLLNILLVPHLGIFGAAISFCITKVMMFFLTLFYFRKHFKIEIKLVSFLSFFAVASVYCYLIYVMNRYLYLLMLIPLIAGIAFYVKSKFKGYFTLKPA
jgi:O-antigen/teichoic acid export membrane protein